MMTFWAIRRVDRNYVEPTLYKSEVAAGYGGMAIHLAPQVTACAASDKAEGK